MTILCSFKNLTLTYPHKSLFKEVSFTLNQGDKIGVLGLNGHGKSSLFKILNETATADTTVPPFILDKNKDFSVFLVPQELPIKKGVPVGEYFYEFYPHMKVVKDKLDVIVEKLTNGEGDMDALIEEQTKLYEKLDELEEPKLHSQYQSYLKSFGIEDMEADIFTCSGGQQRKVALSLGLCAPHQIILWDEPTNHLDLETIEIFEDELITSKKTFMIITHDRTLLNNVVDRIIHIREGKLATFKGTYGAYLEYLKEQAQRRAKEIDKLSNLHRAENLWISRGAKARRTKSKKRIEDFHSLNEKIGDLKALAHKSAQFQVKSSGRKTKILASFENTSLSFGDNHLFENLNLKVAKGDKIALLGKNGAGKSSMLNLLMETIQPTAGAIKRAHELSVGFFSQKREGLDPNMTPWELIGEGIDYIVSNTGDKKHVAGYLENFLFKSDELKRPISTFSGGEKNRLQLAQFMKHAQDIWIFDEPTNDLDLETIGILEEELKNYKGALIVVGHDRSFIENVTNKCWLLHDKKIEIFEGGMEQAEIYIQTQKLQQKLDSIQQESNQNQGGKNLSNSHKKELAELPLKIEEFEAKINKIENEIASFDISSMDEAKTRKFKKLEEKLSEYKNELAGFYTRWEKLEQL